MSEMINFSKEAFLAYTNKLKKTFQTVSSITSSLGETEYVKITTNLENIDSLVGVFTIKGSYDRDCIESYIMFNNVQPSLSYVYNIGDILIFEFYLDVVDDKVIFYVKFSSNVDTIVTQSLFYVDDTPVCNPVTGVTKGVPGGEASALSDVGVIKNFEDKNQFEIASILDVNSVTGRSTNIAFVNEGGEEISILEMTKDQPVKLKLVTDGSLDFITIMSSDGINVTYEEPYITITTSGFEGTGTVDVLSTINSVADNLQILLKQ